MKAKRTFGQATLLSSRAQGGLGLPAVAVGLWNLCVRELSREAQQKLMMNGVTRIKTTSQISF